MDSITRIFSDSAMPQYYGLIGAICYLFGWILALLSVFRFVALADGRQGHEGGYGYALMTFISGVCLVSANAYLQSGRATFGMQENPGVLYGSFSGWQKDTVDALMNLTRLVGVVFAIKALFVIRQATIKVGEGNMPKGFAMMFVGFILTNPESLYVTIASVLPR